MHFTELMDRQTYWYSNDWAFKQGEKKLRFIDLDLRSNRLANAFKQLGVKRGDRIGIIAHNCPEYFEVMFAAWKLGAATVNVNSRLVGREIEFLLNNSEAVLFVFTDKFAETIESIRNSLGSVRQFVCISDNPPDYAHKYEDLIKRSSTDKLQIQVSDEDLALLLYTSGTTGFPKGVPFTHRSMLATAGTLINGFGYRPGDNYLSVASFGHITVVPCLAHYIVGACTHVLTSTSYDPETTAKIIEKEKITNVFMTPGMFRHLFKVPKIREFDFSAWKACPTGSEPIPETLINDLNEYLPTCGHYIMYGLTEGWLATLLHPHETIKKWPSAGKPVLNTDVRVVSDSGRVLPPGKTGEVVIRGDQVMKGYFRNPEATAETLIDGWLHSGDLGKFDEDGYLYIVGRKKDMIISGGENIYPAEIETVLYKHPKILEAAVLGVPDTEWGESVKAVVVLKPGMTMGEQELIEYCKQNLASYKKPKHIQFVSSLPRTDIGKLNKKELKKLYATSSHD